MEVSFSSSTSCIAVKLPLKNVTLVVKQNTANGVLAHHDSAVMSWNLLFLRNINISGQILLSSALGP